MRHFIALAIVALGPAACASGPKAPDPSHYAAIVAAPDRSEADRVNEARWKPDAPRELIEHAADADRRPDRGKERQVPRDPTLLRRHPVRHEENTGAGRLDARTDRLVLLRHRRARVRTGDAQ